MELKNNWLYGVCYAKRENRHRPRSRLSFERVC